MLQAILETNLLPNRARRKKGSEEVSRSGHQTAGAGHSDRSPQEPAGRKHRIPGAFVRQHYRGRSHPSSVSRPEGFTMAFMHQAVKGPLPRL